MIKRVSGSLFGAVLYVVPFSTQADYNLLEGKYGALQFTFNAKTAAFAENNPWFGKARENIGDAGNFWWEGSAEAGLKGSLNFFGGSELYGAYSYLYAQTVGHDDSGNTFDLNNPGEGDTEKAYVGWRSGSLLSGLGHNALDISAGRQNYTIGSGFLIYTGTSNGGESGAYWMAPRQSFKETVIGRFNNGSVKAEAFHLSYRSREPGVKGTTNGFNIEYSFGISDTVGLTYLHVFNTGTEAIDGLDVYNARADFNLKRLLPGLSIGAEYAFEKNGDRFQSNGGFAKLSYEFENVLWSPELSFRYTGLQGDDPNTERNEAFTPLAYGFSDWGTWYQGEIIGEYVLGNSNLLSYLVALKVKPAKTVDLHLFYYHFIIDQPETLADSVTEDDFADEIDLIVDWKVTSRLSASAVVAVAVPGKAARQFTGGNQVWLHSMLYASWAF